MSGQVEGVEGESWRCSALTEMPLVHGVVDSELPVSTMAKGTPVCSRQKEEVGELGLGHVSMTRQT